MHIMNFFSNIFHDNEKMWWRKCIRKTDEPLRVRNILTLNFSYWTYPKKIFVLKITV